MTNYIENLNEVNNKIQKATNKRDRDKVTLIAVSKTRTVEEINEMIKAGATDIGENKVQEIRDKFGKLLPVKWHMIGHLQTNKVKYIIDKVDMIHSVDSLRLLEEINKRAEMHVKVMDVLIQINVAEEESKFGLKADDVEGFLNSISEYKNINVKGIMIIAPFDESENVRKYFKDGYKLFNELKKSDKSNINMEYISMGMSNDYEVAIEEGSNMVRVGTALFGERNYI